MRFYREMRVGNLMIILDYRLFLIPKFIVVINFGLIL